MKVLITGATGRLGSELVNHLTQEGIFVTTLGKRTINSTIQNHSWSLGMTPKPDAFVGVDCLIHLAWSTKDRGLLDYHLNVGGSIKLFEISNLLGIRVINVSSLSALNPESVYGRAKVLIEQSNLSGINLRIGKIETLDVLPSIKFVEWLWRKLIIVPIPSGLSVQVVEMDKAVKYIAKHVQETFTPGTYTMPAKVYILRDYLKKYYGLKSCPIPKTIVKSFFVLCKLSRTRKGAILYDRWASLVSTDRALRELPLKLEGN